MKISILFLSIISICLSCTNDTDKEPSPIVKTPADTAVSVPDTTNGTNSYMPVDVSPMDMTYFPVDYPKLKMSNATIDAPLARVIYSRPHLGGRKLFEQLLKYGTAWRLGANESTELHLFKSATIQKRRVAAGRYSLYCIPMPDKWTIVLNSSLDSWGLKQDSTKDVMRVEVPVINSSKHFEYFTMIFEKTATGADLVIVWANAEARLPFTF